MYFLNQPHSLEYRSVQLIRASSRRYHAVPQSTIRTFWRQIVDVCSVTDIDYVVGVLYE